MEDLFLSFVWMKKSKDIKVQFMRYAVVGGIAFIADYSSLFIFTEIFKLHYLLSAAFGFLIGLVINYFLSIKWVFDQPKSNKIFKFSIFQ